MKKIINYIKKIDINYWYILGVSIFVVLPLCSNLTINSDDLIYHVTNIYASDINLSLKDLVLYPSKILPFIANNFGYGSGIFYPKLAHNTVTFIYQILKHIGINNIIYSIKVIYFILIYLSGIFMYKLVKKIFKNNNVALLSSCLYITLPYFILDIYIRCALAECFLFIFIPIIFIGIFYLMEKNYKNFYIYFVIGYVGAVNSHLVLSVYLTIFIVIFLLINYKKVFTKDRIISIIKASTIILILISPFITPMIEHKFLGEYRVFQDGIMITKEELEGWLRSITELFLKVDYIQKAEYTNLYYLGIILSFITLVNFKKIVPKTKVKEVIGFIIITLLSFIMTTKLFNWELIPQFLHNIQFPWRLQMFTGFSISIIASLSILVFKKETQKPLILLLIILSLFSFTEQINHEKFEYLDSNSIVNSYWGAGAQQEYLPVKAYKNNYYNTRNKDEIIIRNGSAKIKIIENRTPYLKFKVSDVDNVTLEIPRLYYLGYSIKLENNKKTKYISYKENEYGFIEIDLKNPATVTVSYTGTTGYKVSCLIIFISILISIIYLFKKIKK